MKHSIFAGLALAAVAIVSLPASAMTITTPGVSLGNGVTLVEGGCGPGGFRAGNGFCYPRRRPPPPPYYRRPCPPGYHLTPYGCRPNF